MKMLYANGDSFVFGQGMDNTAIFDFSEKKRHGCFTGIIADTLGLQYQNNSIPGGSNDRIVRTTLTDLAKLTELYNPEDILVIIGWTEASRTEFCITDRLDVDADNWDGYLAYMDNFEYPNATREIKELWELYTAYFSHERDATIRYINNVVLLQEYLKAKKFKFMFLETIFTFNSRTLFNNNSVYVDQRLLSQIDKSTFMTEPTSFDTFCRMYQGNNFKYSKCNHPLDEGHLEFSKYLLKLLKERNII